MLLENKALIFCILGSHNEVLMHYLGLSGFEESSGQKKATMQIVAFLESGMKPSNF
jgi:hypothetical protein